VLLGHRDSQGGKVVGRLLLTRGAPEILLFVLFVDRRSSGTLLATGARTLLLRARTACPALRVSMLAL
jgi:hypothetical protein